ncbi:MAG: MFS transporter [Acidimicrobiales bacterium]
MTAPAGVTPDPSPAGGPAPPDSPDRRRQIRGWYAYDWACSAFSTTVVTVFLGPYLTTITERAAGADGYVHPLGLPVKAGSFFPYVLSLSVVLQVFLLPLVGARADRTRRRTPLLGVLAYTGASATMGLYLLSGERYLLGGGLFVVANLAFGAAVVVYNAYLPDLAEPDERDRVSARGWAFGYLGGGILLALNLGFYTLRDHLGVAEGTAVRLSLLSAGVWWALFTLVPMRRLAALPPRPADGPARPAGGFRQLATTLSEARRYPRTLAFLAAYLLFNDGIQTVIALAATFGEKELHLGTTTLIVAILVVQIVAFAGALLLGRLAGTFGAQRVILGSLVVWTLVVAAAYFLPAERPLEFFALAVGIGLVLGGTQALSRSLFSQLIPRGREAQYFGLYEISERGTSWLGTALFGVALQLTDSYRVAIASLVVFFVAGFALLARVDVRRAISDAGNQVPELV